MNNYNIFIMKSVRYIYRIYCSSIVLYQIFHMLLKVMREINLMYLNLYLTFQSNINNNVLPEEICKQHHRYFCAN